MAMMIVAAMAYGEDYCKDVGHNPFLLQQKNSIFATMLAGNNDNRKRNTEALRGTHLQIAMEILPLPYYHKLFWSLTFLQ